MKKYVLGFAFDYKHENIVLIEKQKPEWQKGKYNGVGGKVEPSDANIHFAMAREFYEETGVDTKEQEWFHFATMTFDDDIMGGGAEVYVFRTRNVDISGCSTCEEEVVEIIPMADIYNKPLMHNLPILIPLALQKEFNFIHLKQAAIAQEPIKAPLF